MVVPLVTSTHSYFALLMVLSKFNSTSPPGNCSILPDIISGPAIIYNALCHT